jgi:polyhydroxyalkanoate synthesis regulator protein
MFLRQLARFYGDIMQVLVPRYLEISIDSFTREQEKFRQYVSQTFSTDSFAPLEELVQQNMDMFKRTVDMLASFARHAAQTSETGTSTSSSDEIDRPKC